MGFYEDDRIRSKNAQYQDSNKKSKSSYSLALNEEISIVSIIGALKECGFDVKYEGGTVKITS